MLLAWSPSTYGHRDSHTEPPSLREVSALKALTEGVPGTQTKFRIPHSEFLIPKGSALDKFPANAYDT